MVGSISMRPNRITSHSSKGLKFVVIFLQNFEAYPRREDDSFIFEKTKAVQSGGQKELRQLHSSLEQEFLPSPHLNLLKRVLTLLSLGQVG